MSADVKTLRHLLAAGKNIDDAIVVARAMEIGEDARSIYKLIEHLEAVDAPSAAIGIAVYEVAEKINETNNEIYLRPYRDEHTDARDSNRSRRNMPDAEWRALRQLVFERDGYLCRYCDSSEDLTCDHVVPLVRGGTNDIENLATACRPCNSSKGDKLLEEWRKQWA